MLVHQAESPVSASDRKWTSREEWTGTLDASPWYSFNHFLLRGLPELIRIIVSTSCNPLAICMLQNLWLYNRYKSNRILVNGYNWGKSICDLEDIHGF